MGKLTFGLNVTIDGCCDHRVGIADGELHDHFTKLLSDTGALLYGRITYELMEAHWPAVVQDETAERVHRDFARTLEEIPKYVVSNTRRDFPWKNSFHVEGDLKTFVEDLKEKTPKGVLVGSPRLATQLERLGLIDEYNLPLHPVLVGHGPYLFEGLDRPVQLSVVSSKRLTSGVTVMHYSKR